jgi:hypothetical protein
MPDHPLRPIAAVIAILGALAAALASRVQLLPDVIDLSLVPTGAGLGSLVLVACGALCRLPPDRIGRMSLLGTLLGGFVTAIGVLIAWLAEILS